MPQRLQLRVTNLEWFTNDLVRVRFSLPQPLSFQAGQFMSVAVEGFVRRSYSIANPPHENDYIETYIDCTPGGPGSRFFLGLREGEVVDVMLPLGQFIYRQSHLPVMFFATGTGVVPFLSMIRHELEHIQSGRHITLFYGVREEDRFMVIDELDMLAHVNSNFQYHLFVSKPVSNLLQNFGFRVGRFTQAIPEIDFAGTEVYICGGGAMISEVESMVLKHGASAKHIYYERYY